MKKVRALIADDSVVYRTQIRNALSVYPWMEIIGTASNGKLALDRLNQSQCDLLILDLEMPEMDGLQVLREIARLGIKVKTLVFSSASKRGADITFEALRTGAVDFVTKPGAAEASARDPAETIRQALEPKFRYIYAENFAVAVSAQTLPPRLGPTDFPRTSWERLKPQCLVIGSSTGGPTALEKIFTQLTPPLLVPVLVAQHMPPIFTASLAERITRLSGIRAKEGMHGEFIETNCIYFAPGDYHMTLRGSAQAARICLDQGPHVNSVRPAVDPLFASAAQLYGPHCLGLVLTGMGHDGQQGAAAIKSAGGTVVIQDRASSVVYGMPGAVEAIGAYDRISALDEIALLLRNKIVARACAA